MPTVDLIEEPYMNEFKSIKTLQTLIRLMPCSAQRASTSLLY